MTLSLSSSAQDFKKVWAYCRDDIFKFCELINFDPWGWTEEGVPNIGQVKFLQDVQYVSVTENLDVRRVVAKSGQGAGKTMATVVAALWRHLRNPDALTIVTAPTDRQCKDVFFAELQRVVQKAPKFIQNMLEISSKKLTVVGYPRWVMLGVTASSPESAAGWHHTHMTIVLEEFSGIDDPIVNAFTGTASQEWNVILAVGNPTKREGALFRAFHGATAQWPFRSTFSKLELSKLRSKIASPGLIEAARQEHGEESDYWRVRILGEFPFSSGSTILPYDVLVRATEVPKHEGVRGSVVPVRRIGIDLARFGGDRSAIYARSGNAVVDEWYGIEEPYDTVMRSFEMQKDLGWEDSSVLFVVDSVGMGQSLLVFFERAGKEYMDFGSHKASWDIKFKDQQTIAWFRARDVARHQVMSIPDDKELLEQLSTRLYTINDTSGAMQVESKSDYKKRGFKSPDKADAFVMTFINDDWVEQSTGLYLPSRHKYD